jgi:amidase
MNVDSLHYASLQEVARLIKARELSPVELTQHMLDRIEAVDKSLHSYATVMPERALWAAQRAEDEIAAGGYRGPLHGVPVALKDLCFTRGTRTMGGLRVLRDFLPDYDGTAVTRLEDAGAVILGKLSLTEGAMVGYHRDFKVPVNPWNADYWAGASSSGSGVAVAAGLCFAALGSDTGGSIRFPSMANGIVGLKPSYGRVSRYGLLTLAASLDHLGPMTRSVGDAAIVLEAIAGFDDKDPSSLQSPAPTAAECLSNQQGNLAGMRIGYDPEFASEGMDPGLRVAIEQALTVLETLGASLVPVSVPIDSDAMGEVWFALCTREALAAHADTFPSRADEYGTYFREFLEIGTTISDAQYAAAQATRDAFNAQFNAVLGSVDAIACSAGGITVPFPSEALYGGSAELQPMFDAVQMEATIPADFAGTPALTLPCGFNDNGIPFALQLLGADQTEARLCKIGCAYERATPWHERHPDC